MKLPPIAVTCLALACGGPIVNETDVIAIVGATLIDGTEAQPIPEAVVLTSEGKIKSVGARADVEIPAGAVTIDASGKTIIPGLADLHSHYAIFEPDTELAKRQLAWQLAFGVTTVRSIGLDAEETMAAIEEVRSGNALGPRIYTAGLGFAHPGGQPTQFGLGYVRQPETPEQAREGVRELASQKVDFIKVWIGSRQEGVPKMRREITEAIVDEARIHGIPVVAHVEARNEFDYLLSLGVTDFLHTLVDQDPTDPSFIKTVQRDGVSFTPTMSGIESSWIFAEEPSLVESDPALQAVLGTELVEKIADPKWREEQLTGNSFGNTKSDLESAQHFTTQMHRAGVMVLPGSDCPVIPHGWGTHNELRLLVDAGMEPIEAIRAATAQSAQRLGSTEFGTIVAGAAADLIILDADPLKDIKNTLKIARVMQAGRWVDRKSLLGL
jgi:imidazolonepropionase-like amidohydrolase